MNCLIKIAASSWMDYLARVENNVEYLGKGTFRHFFIFFFDKIFKFLHKLRDNFSEIKNSYKKKFLYVNFF